MNTAPIRLKVETGGLLTIAAAPTPPNCIHAPDSYYVHTYWLTCLGPTSTLAFERLASWVPETGSAIQIDFDELAHNLGTAPARIARALERLAGFGLATIDPAIPAMITIKTRAPNLHPRLLEKLAERCPTLYACHPRTRIAS